MIAVRRDVVRPAALAVVVIVVDQLTKLAVTTALETGDAVELAFGFEIANVRNRGVAFGMLSGQTAVILGLVALALTGLIAYYVMNARRAGAWIATGLVLGGAFGNLIDRLTLGYVRDFIDFVAWPAFNVADSAITIGIIVLFVSLDGRAGDG